MQLAHHHTYAVRPLHVVETCWSCQPLQPDINLKNNLMLSIFTCIHNSLKNKSYKRDNIFIPSSSLKCI